MTADREPQLPTRPTYEGIGDVWRVTVEQWNRMTTTEGPDGITGWGGDRRPDAIAYAVAHTAADAAQIIEDAFTTNSGPLTRVTRVEFAGPVWKAADHD